MQYAQHVARLRFCSSMKLSTRIYTLFIFSFVIPAMLALGILAYYMHRNISKDVETGLKAEMLSLEFSLEFHRRELLAQAKSISHNSYLQRLVERAMTERLGQELRKIKETTRFSVVSMIDIPGIGDIHGFTGWEHGRIVVSPAMKKIYPADGVAGYELLHPRTMTPVSYAELATTKEIPVVSLTAVVPVERSSGIGGYVVLRQYLNGWDGLTQHLSVGEMHSDALLFGSTLIAGDSRGKCSEGSLVLTKEEQHALLNGSEIAHLNIAGSAIFKPVQGFSGEAVGVLSVCNDGSEYAKLFQMTIWILAVIAVVAVIAVIIAARIVQRRIVLPLNYLVAETGQILDAERTGAVPPAMDEEFRTLASAFTSMQGKIDGYRIRLEGSEKMARSLLSASPLKALLMDSTGKIIDGTDDVLRLLFPEDATGDRKIRMDVRKGLMGHIAQMMRNFPETRQPASADVEDDGHYYRIILVPLREGGTPEHSLIAVFLDDRTEEVFRRQELERARTLAIVGQMSAGVAHEVNNPITYIRMNAELVKRFIRVLLQGDDVPKRVGGISREEAEKEIPVLLDSIVSGCDRVHGIVDSIKDMMLKGDKKVSDRTVSLNKIVVQTIEMLSPVIKEKTFCFDMRLAEVSPTVFGNEGRLGQVVSNIIQNALESLPTKDSPVSVSTFVNDEGWSVVQVKDRGCGMDAATLAKVRDPFFTTRRDVGGLGMGLALCDAIVKEHGGEIQIQSEPWEGTTVSLLFPPFG